ncbi:MAG: S-adenosylmethionine:tRNA ribosyltransferase-isomerase [Bacteroidetes bacterium]|nr:S-adenosylmethionine:tRNA ribosyltransferase-isomerase [Bacteroidota bacterium]
MNTRDIRIADYTYVLPDDRIAKYPLPDRDLSKLLLYQNGAIAEDIYRNISVYIPSDSLVIFNDTKVVHARLLFPKETGSTIEVFCLEPNERYADITTGMMQTQEVYWKCLVGKADKWKEKELYLRYPEHGITLTASIVEKLSDCYVIHLRWDTDATFAEILYLAGAVPLPPYIKRKADKADSDTYQTIYSRAEGSVAAPTAGLHFTERIFNDFRAKKIHWDFVTLHVGAGTFKPVKAEVIADHQMHAEWLDVPVTLVEKLRDAITAGRNIVAVGTTATRTLESLYWIGSKVHRKPDTQPSQVAIQQWDAYESEGTLSTTEALDALLSYLHVHDLDRIITRTQLLIAPGYQWRLVKELVTNFHQPDSTLLLLVAALVGDDWRKLYDYALAHDFRFLSYGDGCYLRNTDLSGKY